VYVVATTVPATGQAIATASALAKPMDARVHVIAARPMPTEWSLDQRSAPVQAFAREIKCLIRAVTTPINMIDVTLLLPQGALVIIAGPSHRWWPTTEQRLAHDLNGLGHRVMFLHQYVG
jgi:hypothetical protein